MGNRGGGDKESTRFFEKMAETPEDKATHERSEKAAIVVKAILRDLTDRKGLGNAWEDIDEDIQQEIIETWEGIVATGMKT